MGEPVVFIRRAQVHGQRPAFRLTLLTAPVLVLRWKGGNF